METATTMSPSVGIVPLCLALGLPRSSFYRHLLPKPEPQARPAPARALSTVERQVVLDVLHSERFADRSPAEAWATLLTEGTHLCSLSTMYRILSSNEEVRERRNQLRHPNYSKPELVARHPNEVWSWDITKLKGPAKWEYYYLYVILDIFSRYVVAWMVAQRENANLSGRLIRAAYEKQGVQPKTLVLHADRGSPMTANTTTQLLASLGVERSHNRPHVSNDNPFSESQFRTVKYHPTFPERFGSIEHSLDFCRGFFPWYNDEHAHSALQYLTPKQVHHGEAEQVLRQRHTVLLKAYEQHPERFVAGPPKMPRLLEAVWINEPKPRETEQDQVGVPVTESIDSRPKGSGGKPPSRRSKPNSRSSEGCHPEGRNEVEEARSALIALGAEATAPPKNVEGSLNHLH